MLYDRITAALQARDADAWNDFLHDDFEFVRHQSGGSFDKAQTVEMMRGFMASDAVTERDRRCLYENDEVLVVHSVMDFADGSREAVLVAYTVVDGKITRCETGATPVAK